MAEDLAQRARDGMEAFNRGDLDEAVEGFSSEIVWEVAPDLVPDAARAYKGHEGVRRFWSEWRDVFEGFEIDVVECRAIDERRVFSVIRVKGVGAGSGTSVTSPEFFQVFEFDNDEVVRVRLSPHRAAALGEV